MLFRSKSKLAAKENFRSNRRQWLTTPEDASLIDILDRVLDHGIVIEPSARVRLGFLNLHNRYEHFVIDRKESWLPRNNKTYRDTH